MHYVSALYARKESLRTNRIFYWYVLKKMSSTMSVIEASMQQVVFNIGYILKCIMLNSHHYYIYIVEKQ